MRDVSKQIENLVEEISFLIHKMQTLSNIILEKVDLESFKFCFTVASSLISELLEVLAPLSLFPAGELGLAVRSQFRSYSQNENSNKMISFLVMSEQDFRKFQV